MSRKKINIEDGYKNIDIMLRSIAQIRKVMVVENMDSKENIDRFIAEKGNEYITRYEDMSDIDFLLEVTKSLIEINKYNSTTSEKDGEDEE